MAQVQPVPNQQTKFVELHPSVLLPVAERPEFPDRREVVAEQKRAAEQAALEAARKAEAERLAIETTPPPKSTQTASTQATGGSVWDQLAQCESGGRWDINTGNGFFGGLQFDFGTWGQYKGYYTANLAPREIQIEKAEQVRAARGFAPWPACSAKLGLL